VLDETNGDADLDAGHTCQIAGLARWVDMTLFPHTHLSESLASLTQYYNSPQRSLLMRSYDAVGFPDRLGLQRL
jgi:hypothetical protein